MFELHLLCQLLVSILLAHAPHVYFICVRVQCQEEFRWECFGREGAACKHVYVTLLGSRGFLISWTGLIAAIGGCVLIQR